MDTVGRSNSPTPGEVGLHYASGYEARRHETGGGKLDAARTQELMRRFLPSPPALVRDVGGGPGGHSCWLAREGYEVHLVDLVPLHVELARRASEDQPNHPLASIAAADARTLPWNEGTSDAVLLVWATLPLDGPNRSPGRLEGGATCPAKRRDTPWRWD